MPAAYYPTVQSDNLPLPTDLNTTMPIEGPPLPRPYAPEGKPIEPETPLTIAQPFDFNSLDDEDLMGLASLLGIDTGAFGGQNQNMDMFQIDPAVRDAVSRVYESQRQLGSQELHRKAVESAGARGLNMTDTPVSDPYMRGQALLESQLRGNEAASLLGIGTDWSKHRDTMFSSLYNGDANRDLTRQMGIMSLFNTGSQIGLGLNNNNFTQSSSGQSGGLSGSGLGAIGVGLQGLGSSGLGSWLGGLFGGGGDNTPTSGFWGDGGEFTF